MAKIGMITFPGSGHVYPMAALGRNLMDRGHQVTFFNLLDMEQSIGEAGIPFRAYGTKEFPVGSVGQFDRQIATMQGSAALKTFVAREAETCRLQLTELPSMFAKEGLDLLLVDFVEGGALTAAEHVGLPAISVCLIPPVMNEASAPPPFFGWRYRTGRLARARNWFGNRLAALALRPVLKVIARQRAAWKLPKRTGLSVFYSPRLTITQMPELLDFPRKRWPVHFLHTGPFIDKRVRTPVPFPWERLNGKPVVYASMGTLQNGVVPVFEAILKAVASFDVQLVLSTGDTIAVEALIVHAGSAVIVNRAPQLELIQRADLVITHAGLNSSLEALTHGKPMVAIPVASDQPGVARRLERLGVAEVVPVAKVSVRRLKAALKKVFNDKRYRERALEVQKELAALHGLDRAASIIDETLQPASR